MWEFEKVHHIKQLGLYPQKEKYAKLPFSASKSYATQYLAQLKNDSMYQVEYGSAHGWWLEIGLHFGEEHIQKEFPYIEMFYDKNADTYLSNLAYRILSELKYIRF